VLQLRVSALCGQAAPPFSGATLVRERLWAPVPHDLVHAVQAPNEVTMQFAAQASSLQLRVSALCGQALPPAAGCVMVRERLWLPVPHDLVHVVHAPNAGTTQSMGHMCELHMRVSALCGQAAPPTSGCVCERERLWLPVPHDLVQVVQAPKLPGTQSSGHAWALQLRVSARYGHT
jgi:hypothetical protein